jgi:hypothetical protein
VAHPGHGRGRGDRGPRRRRRRGQRAAAVRIPGGPGQINTTAWHQTSGTGPAGAHLSVRYRHQLWGTQMEVNVTGLQPGSVCQFQVVDASGRPEVVGSWMLWKDGSWYPASTWHGEKDLRSFQVTINGKVVASAPVT